MVSSPFILDVDGARNDAVGRDSVVARDDDDDDAVGRDDDADVLDNCDSDTVKPRDDGFGDSDFRRPEELGERDR